MGWRVISNMKLLLILEDYLLNHHVCKQIFFSMHIRLWFAITELQIEV